VISGPVRPIQPARKASLQLSPSSHTRGRVLSWSVLLMLARGATGSMESTATYGRIDSDDHTVKENSRGSLSLLNLWKKRGVWGGSAVEGVDELTRSAREG
jgi:hypothetical protein